MRGNCIIVRKCLLSYNGFERTYDFRAAVRNTGGAPGGGAAGGRVQVPPDTGPAGSLGGRAAAVR